MKTTLILAVIILFTLSCNTPKSTSNYKEESLLALKENDTVSIKNEDLEYEIIIIEPGFNFWLASRAQPKGFYSQSFLENRNLIYVNEWNYRVLQPQQFDPNLYELQIDYRPNIDYGYDVNYQLYNYFIYFQLHYKQRLGPFEPRI